MKKRSYLLLVVIAAFSFLASSWYYNFFPFTKSPYLCIPLQFCEGNLPFTQVEIGGKQCYLMIDTGAGSEFSLRKELLDTISKKPLPEKVASVDLKGILHESQQFILPRAKIQTSWIKQILIREESYVAPPSEHSMWGIGEALYQKNGTPIDGRIGWRFLTSFYPFFDIGNSVFYFTRGPSSLPKLEEKGYSIKSLFSSPFKLDWIGCVFTVDSNLGKKKFLLDTGCTYSLIKASIVSPEKKVTTLHNVTIGDYSIGDMEFHLLDFAEQFDEIDGIIGMDFLSKHIIYLDFKAEKALIGPSRQL